MNGSSGDEGQGRAEVVGLSVPSRVEHLDILQDVAERLASLAGLDREQCLDFGLAVREGAINAMKHGHGFEASRPVALTFRFDENELVARIRDTGEGFDPRSIPDPTVPENLLRSSGRGLLLIHSLVDEVSFERHDVGMELVIRRQISSAGKAAGESS
jgi:serine/threonine-protein kinase RsbW